MSKMTPSKALVLKPFVLQIFWCKFGERFRSILQKSHLFSFFLTLNDSCCLICEFFKCRFHEQEKEKHHHTGQVFPKRIKITPKIHIKKIKERTAWGQVPSWESFLTSTEPALTQRTLWMSDMIPSKAPVLKLYVLQFFGCEFWEWFWSFFKKIWPVILVFFP